MKATVIPFKPPTSDPYDEDVCGSHLGESVVINCGDGLKIVVEEMRSGIGPSFYVYAEAQGKRAGRFYAFIDDDGEFCHGYEHREEKLK